MPELPEVQTVVDHLRKYLYGEKIISIDSIWKKSLSNFNPANLLISNSGEEIKSINRRGKFIILNLPTCILAIHLRMTGKFYLLNDEQIPKHTTVIFGLESGKKLIFEDTRKFGRIYLYKNIDIINQRLGPEPLGKKFTPNWLISNIKKKKRMIKALLLDQSFLAGLGNIYVDESLWTSGIHPKSISNVIPISKGAKLHHAILKTLKDAINFKGTTILSFSYLKGERGNYATQLKVFGQNGKSCQKCGDEIEKIRVAGRGTYICKQCQRIYI